ncbi:MAG: hypothetical protein ACFFCS_26115 [Candidatus Hodarchaeota archaeon]
MKTSISKIIKNVNEALFSMDADPDSIENAIEQLKLAIGSMDDLMEEQDIHELIKMKSDLLEIVDLIVSDDFIPIRRLREVARELKNLRSKYGL